MELDPRIKSVSDILTPFDVERAKEFIGQKGFFANSIDCFRAGEPYCVYGTLTNVLDDQSTSPYLKGSHNRFSFFLPESSLKPEEKKPEGKKYRPYTLMEFDEKFTVGRPIKYRGRGSEGRERHLILNGYWNSQSEDEIYVYIGPFSYALEDLFVAYEWLDPDTGDWRPFGVEVEE